MYSLYFNSGTSNTRLYLLKNNQVIDFLKDSLGSRDSSIAGSKNVLKEKLADLFHRILKDNNVAAGDLKQVFGSGMVTSPFGLKEIDHLSTPLSLEKLAKNIGEYSDKEFFTQKINLIPGVKTIADDFKVTEDNIASVNNMRGEEIEIFGLLSVTDNLMVDKDIYIFLPGSHTHIARIKNGVLEDILSTFSGELFSALKESTILSDSLEYGAPLEKKMLKLGFSHLQKYGFSRALYLVNTMQIFTELDDTAKTSYLEGIINGGVVAAFQNNFSPLSAEAEIIIPDKGRMAHIFKVLLKESAVDIKINIASPPAGSSWALEGYKQLIEQI